MSKPTAQKSRGFNSKPIELGASYSRRSNVSSLPTNSQGTYVYGNVAPAIEPKVKKTNRKTENKAVKFKPVTSTKTETKVAHSQVHGVVKLFVACMSVFAVIGFLNITFTSMAVAASTQAEAISSQISAEREVGKAMEVEYGTLSNPATIKEKAIALGMEVPSDVMQINLKKDSVVMKDDGSIALSSTLKAVVNQ